MTAKKVKELLEIAKLMGVSETVIDGNKYTFKQDDVPKAVNRVPDVEAKDLVAPLSTFDEPSEEDVLYWSSSYYDELQAQKAEQSKQIKESKDLRSTEVSNG